MRCEDLIRELATPSGAGRSPEIAQHLATCPGCADWAERAGRFDRIWAATRATEPSEAAIDALWARASAELELADRAPATLRFVALDRRRRRFKTAFLAAQVAAILLAALFLFRRAEVRPPVEVAIGTTAEVGPGLLELDVEDGEFSVVRLDTVNRPRVEKLASSTLPADNTPVDEINAAESMGSPFVTTVVSK